ncbi:MAG: polyprenyl synthetase family protein [Chloroflexota bacterium]|nr:polyprenyl synthetase family protein [Chloroflexota bacterium]
MEKDLKTLSGSLLPSIEHEIRTVVARVQTPETEELYYMLAYHLGWVGEGAGAGAVGKRIRPLLVLLTTGAAGGQWEHALPAAVAVELLHNFSLIHDDIEDHSPLRRGRPTLWKQWGIPQAINSGDTMFTLANIAILELEKSAGSSIALLAAKAFQETTLALTGGQYLDLAFESRSDLTIDDYWNMIGGKTASLIGTCTRIGALVAGCNETAQNTYQEFGVSLGLAFQIQDDWLGIWGDSNLTGKSAESDLISGKKTLPVLYGLSKKGEFARRWTAGDIQSLDVPELAQLLDSEGAKAYTQERVNYYTNRAISRLHQTNPHGDYGQALIDLTELLLNRKS